MNIFSPNRINALRNFLIATTAAFSFSALADELHIPMKGSEIFSEPNADASKAAPTATKSEPASEGRKIQFLQVSPTLLQFEFPRFSYFWLTTEGQYKTFWSQNSRLNGDAPKLNIDWKTESLLAIFWESKEGVVRIPTFMGSEESVSDGVKELKLTFGQNSPCFGIITRTSPSMFLVVDKNFADLDSITLRTETTKTTGCF